MTIDADLKTMAQAKNFAALTTLMPDGQPQTQLMWVHADDDHVIINTETGRQKFANITVDPRVTVTVFDATNPYRYVEARGRVAETVTGDEGYFVFPVVPADTYTLRITMVGFKTVEVPAFQVNVADAPPSVEYVIFVAMRTPRQS